MKQKIYKRKLYEPKSLNNFSFKAKVRMAKNIFCEKDDLGNESSVEQFFVIRLLKELGYPDSKIMTKKSLSELAVGRGSKKENYKPDYALKIQNRIRILLDAKSTNQKIENYFYQISNYALSLNQKDQKQSVKYCILTNGIKLCLYEWDKEKPLLEMVFEDFTENNPKFVKLKNLLDYKEYKILEENEYSPEYYNIGASELPRVFQQCHDLIWKKEKLKPTDAFYEFSKIFFIKLHYDKKMNNEILKKGKKITKADFVFSCEWIEENEKIKKNPMKILFDQIKEDLEDKIRSKSKKRIFEKDEELRLSPSTVKEVVKILQPINLFRVDEDLNGRMFEAFLNATIRGKELGQFFTPRSVVKFMTKMADIQVDKDYHKTDYILDACCGSGGFLIEMMADMYKKISDMNLTESEKEKLKEKVVKENIWGIDAGKSAYMMISRIARMNMFLHGDGSNRIYYLPDSLDKEINTEEIEDKELLEEAEELKKTLQDGLKFDMVLTNPPFSMKYSSDNPDEKRILQEYAIANVIGTTKLKAVKSNVLFIERYYDLLKPRGKLITVIDEAVLNTDSDKPFRDFIKKHFEIKAVISLPKNTFVNAETFVKTSILYLVKKEKPNDEQPTTFMAICENVGHKDNGKPDLENNELPDILEKFKQFEKTGKL